MLFFLKNILSSLLWKYILSSLLFSLWVKYFLILAFFGSDIFTCEVKFLLNIAFVGSNIFSSFPSGGQIYWWDQIYSFFPLGGWIYSHIFPSRVKQIFIFLVVLMNIILFSLWRGLLWSRLNKYTLIFVKYKLYCSLE